MSIVAIVLPLALLIVGAAVGAFIWAARTGQFDDTETPASRVLVDDASPVKPAQPGSAERRP